jgi:hypothetical protein
MTERFDTAVYVYVFLPRLTGSKEHRAYRQEQAFHR